ncbi:hypothetical protein LEP1GSC041_2496 [Leptospira noguchii str. 2006001870]|nr:hypothetical protein LEP1GSC041_2496 [Leptospira noguchii str. 2006001870]EMO26782.1 hypothetical protein LEP1GSC170_3197 [Leptospira interrogans serovar Bataviae str. HAI135]
MNYEFFNNSNSFAKLLKKFHMTGYGKHKKLSNNFKKSNTGLQLRLIQFTFGK